MEEEEQNIILSDCVWIFCFQFKTALSIIQLLEEEMIEEHVVRPNNTHTKINLLQLTLALNRKKKYTYKYMQTDFLFKK